MTPASYPRGKVFLAFLLCPLVPGFIAGLVNSGLMLAHLATHPRLIGEVRGGEILLMPLLTPLVAFLVFLLPMFVLALGVVLLKVRRSAFSCNVLALLGSVMVTGWVLLFIRAVVNGVERARYADYLPGMLLLWLAAAVTCWLTARCFLPSPDSPPVCRAAPD